MINCKISQSKWKVEQELKNAKEKIASLEALEVSDAELMASQELIPDPVLMASQELIPDPVPSTSQNSQEDTVPYNSHDISDVTPKE